MNSSFLTKVKNTQLYVRYLQHNCVSLRVQDFDKEDFYKQIGKRIKRERSILGLNQLQLGQKVGISRVSVVNIEKGKQMPPVHVIWKISIALQTSVDRLFPVSPSESSSFGLEKGVKVIGDQIKSENLKNIFNQLQPNP